MSLCLALLLASLTGLCTGESAPISCVQVPGALVQIDASNGRVFGVNAVNSVYTLYEGIWTRLQGAFTHVTVGPAGVWAVNSNNSIFRLVGGDWVKIDGSLKQIDAGGACFVAGVNSNNDIFCLSSTVYMKNGSSLPWNHIEGKLIYYSCGRFGCWGVNPANDIFFRHSVSAMDCAGARWEHIRGKLAMIEVGTDGSVYGVNSAGNLFRRDGITDALPIGNDWTQLTNSYHPFKHVSPDRRHLWVLTQDQKILKCQ